MYKIYYLLVNFGRSKETAKKNKQPLRRKALLELLTFSMINKQLEAQVVLAYLVPVSSFSFHREKKETINKGESKNQENLEHAPLRAHSRLFIGSLFMRT